MATPWPQMAAWPNDPCEHAAYLSDYLRKALVCIDSAEDQLVPKSLVKTMIAAMSVFTTKFQNTPDLSAVTTIQSDLKTTAETVQSTAIKVQQNTITHQQVAALSQETNQAVKEAAETRRITTELLQETNDIAKAINDTAKATNDIVKVAQSTPPSKASYASVLTSNAAPLSKPITLSTQTSSFVQAQREIIVKITDPATIESLRAKSPRNLQNHIDRAIEQSRNEHIERRGIPKMKSSPMIMMGVDVHWAGEWEAMGNFKKNTKICYENLENRSSSIKDVKTMKGGKRRKKLLLNKNGHDNCYFEY